MILKKALLSLLFFSSLFFYSQDFGEKPKLSDLKFGEVKVNKILFEKDLIIEGYSVSKRKKGPSKPLKEMD